MVFWSTGSKTSLKWDICLSLCLCKFTSTYIKGIQQSSLCYNLIHYKTNKISSKLRSDNLFLYFFYHRVKGLNIFEQNRQTNNNLPPIISLKVMEATHPQPEIRSMVVIVCLNVCLGVRTITCLQI